MLNISFFPFSSSYQELPTHQSVSLVSRGRSALSLAPPHVTPVLGTPTLAMVPVPAPPVTQPFNMQVWIPASTRIEHFQSTVCWLLEQHYEIAVQYSVELKCYQCSSQKCITEPRDRTRACSIFSHSSHCCERKRQACAFSVAYLCDHEKEPDCGRYRCMWSIYNRAFQWPKFPFYFYYTVFLE